MKDGELKNKMENEDHYNEYEKWIIFLFFTWFLVMLHLSFRFDFADGKYSLYFESFVRFAIIYNSIVKHFLG